MSPVHTGAEALELLRTLVDEAAADPAVVQAFVHRCERAVEAAVALTDGLRRRLGPRPPIDAGAVQVGAALRGVGLLCSPPSPAEGRRLLLARGLPDHQASLSVTLEDGPRDGLATEALLILLAEVFATGERDPALEARVVERLARASDHAQWRVNEIADGVFEAVASRGRERHGRDSPA